MLPFGMPVRIGVCAPNRPPSRAMHTTRLSGPAVAYAYSTGLVPNVAVSTARPSRPPSPPGSTPSTVPTVSARPPPAGIRLTSAVSRSLTSTDPSGSTAPLHGTDRPVATSVGSDSAARVPLAADGTGADEPPTDGSGAGVPGAPAPVLVAEPDPGVLQPARAKAPRAPAPST